MSFANDLKEFSAGFSSGFSMMEKRRKSDLDDDYRNRALDLRDIENEQRSYESDRNFQLRKEEIEGPRKAGEAGAEDFDKRGGGQPSDPSLRLNSADPDEAVPKLPTFARGDPNLDRAVRTVYGEAAGQGTVGRQAVAAVIKNRADQSGKSPAEIVMEKNQFEPWWNRAARQRMMSLSPDDPKYQQIAKEVQDIWSGRARDPTGGATHFVAPKAQAALGRPMPSWARGTPTVIGDHNFYRLGYGNSRNRHGIPDRRVEAVPLEDEEDQTLYAASGGLIEDPDEFVRGADQPGVGTTEYAPADRPAEAVPVDQPPAAYAALPAEVTPDAIPTPPPRPAVIDHGELTDVDGAREAVRGGLSFLQEKFTRNNGAVSQAGDPDAAKAWGMSIGAATGDDLKQIDDKVDPERKMKEDQREIARYNAMYKYFMARGEPEKAQRSAAAMLMSAKSAAAQYGSLAAIALEKGNTKKAGEAIEKSYELLPNGQNFKVEDADKKGIKFSIYDSAGKVTEQGMMAIDDMMQVATGMRNGSAFLQAATGFATSAPTAAERKAASEQKAMEEFDEVEGENARIGYVATLSDEGRKKFYALPKQKQHSLSREFERRQDADRKQANIEYRDATREENEHYRRTWQLFNTARQQGNWEEQREQAMSQNDKRMALFERDLSDRNVRHQESAEARQKRYQQVDERILQQGLRGKVARLTAPERAEQKRQSALDIGLANAPLSSNPQEGIDAEGNPVASGFSAQQEREGALRAQHGYAAATAGDKSQIDMDETAKAVDDYRAANKMEPAAPAQRSLTAQLAGQIARGNPMPTEGAVAVAHAALNRQVPLRFVPDPTNPDARMIMLGNNPPVRLGADALNMIAFARGGSLNPVPGRDPRLDQPVTPRGNRNPDGAGQAIPGVSGNPITPTARGIARGLRAPLNPVQEKQRAIDDEEKARRYRAKRQALDLEYSGDVGMIRP